MTNKMNISKEQAKITGKFTKKLSKIAILSVEVTLASLE